MSAVEWMREYAQARASEPVEDLHWLGSDTLGQGEEVYCRSCAEKKRSGDQFIDGGWSWDSDNRRWCETCGKELRCSPTDYAANEEIAYLQENGPPADAEDWHCLAWAMRALSANDERWAKIAALYAAWGIQPARGERWAT